MKCCGLIYTYLFRLSLKPSAPLSKSVIVNFDDHVRHQIIPTISVETYEKLSQKNLRSLVRASGGSLYT